ncbi:AsmA family protein [Vampirovibrio sp.]|uniref:AsmA family protein n=1 Tax=Vampirovibrio sp. TaxID=2717857 RepID=UPI003593086C
MKPARKRIVILALSVGIAGYALLKTVPLFMDTTDIKRQIEDGLNKSTGVHFTIQELTLEPTLFHGIQAHLNTTAITDIKHRKLGTVENISVQIRYLPLLTRQTPEIAKIHLKHVYIPVGEQSLFTAIHLKLVKPEKTGFLNPAELKNAELLLSDYLIEDTIPADSTRQGLPKVRRFHIAGKQISIRNLEAKQPIQLLATGQLAYLIANPKASQLAKQAMGDYRLTAEVPQFITDGDAGKKTFTIADLQRLTLTINGQPVNLDFNYQHLPKQLAEGQLKSTGVDLFQAQALVFQLADTLGMPIPTEYSPYWASGKTKLDTRFKLAFKGGQPVFQEANGRVDLNNLALYAAQNRRVPLVDKVNGAILLKGKLITLKAMNLMAQGLPFHVNGHYNLANDRIDAVMYGHNLNVDALARKTTAMGAPPNALQGRDIRGLLNIDARLTGTGKMPVYRGLIAIRDGAFSDQSQGIFANHVSGKVSFHGRGLSNPLIHYQGLLTVHDGKLIIASQGVNVNQFDGNVTFNGQIRPEAKTLAMPTLNGLINVRNADYKDPKSGVPLTDIKGVLRLAGNWIQIENFRALLGGSTFQANGKLATNLQNYQVRLTGKQIDLPRLKREVLNKLPDFQAVAAQIDPYQGLANLDLTVSTGLNLAGRLDVNDLALRTETAENPLRIPHLSLLFDRQTITLPDAAVLYGPVAATVGGNFTTQGAYNVRLDSGTVPMDFVRDNQDLLASLAGAKLPEIWNTAGDLNLRGTLSNQRTDMTMAFNHAGLSWAGGDFPLYDLNGQLLYQQANPGQPVVQSQNLTLVYGDSPMTINLQQNQALQGEIQGTLSDLTVNHFLVSHHSNATPYRAIPFKTELSGTFAALPGQPGFEKNDLNADLFFSLNQNFRQAYSDVAPATQPPKSNEQLKTEAISSADFSAEAPDILEPNGKKNREVLKNINAINAANTALGAANTTVGIFRQTVGKGLGLGLDTLKRPGQFIAQKVLDKPHESVETKAIDPNALPDKLQLDKLAADKGQAFFQANLHLLGNDLLLERANLHLFGGGDIVAEGKASHLDDPEKLSYQAHVVTVPELNLEALNQGAVQNTFFNGATGTLGADVQIAGTSAKPNQLNGWVATNRLAIPYLTLQDITGRVDLNGETAVADVPSFKIPGVTARVSGRSDTIFEVPIPLEDVVIDASFASIDSLAIFNNEVVKPKLIDQVVHNYLRPWQQGDPTSAVQFRNAKLHADEVIYQNIILSNLQSLFSLNANSFFELTNTTLQAAGGNVSGYLSMSPNQNSFTTLELNANGVKANALTKALLDVTNEIFGDLDGTVRFTTFGQSDQELQKNANGTVSMKITDGRLPAIAKVETLLATANVFRGGVLGLNLNNLFRSLTIYDTNYFAELSGDMLINDQILYTQNLVSDGVNLDLLIQGSLRMDNGNANMLINGRMSQDITGKLGKLGNLSLGRLFRFIPALGTFGENRPGLLGYIPGVGYVPGFGGPAGKYNRFQVRLVGQPDDPAAIQDFQWVRPQNL